MPRIRTSGLRAISATELIPYSRVGPASHMYACFGVGSLDLAYKVSRAPGCTFGLQRVADLQHVEGRMCNLVTASACKLHKWRNRTEFFYRAAHVAELRIRSATRCTLCNTLQTECANWCPQALASCAKGASRSFRLIVPRMLQNRNTKSRSRASGCRFYCCCTDDTSNLRAMRAMFFVLTLYLVNELSECCTAVAVNYCKHTQLSTAGVLCRRTTASGLQL